MRSWVVWAAAVVSPGLAGCGTVGNVYPLGQEVRVYGGVRGDWASLQMAVRDDTCISWPFVPFVVADLLLSAVGDTLTLPYTLIRDRAFLGKPFVYEPQPEALAADRPATTTHPAVADR